MDINLMRTESAFDNFILRKYVKDLGVAMIFFFEKKDRNDYEC